VLEDVRARDRADDAVHRERGGKIVAEDPRVGVRQTDDGSVAEVGDGRVVVDVGAAPGEKPVVLDTLDRLADPALVTHGALDSSQPRARMSSHRSPTRCVKSSSRSLRCSSPSAALLTVSGGKSTVTVLGK